MHPGIAPVPVEVELGQGGAAASQLEQFLAGLQRDLRGQYLGLGHGNRCPRCGSSIDRPGIDLVEHPRGLAQQRLGSMQFKFQAADVGNHVGVIAGALDLGLDPRPGFFAHEGDGVVDGCLGDTGIDGGLNQLRGRALDVGDIALAPVVDDQFGIDRDLIEQHGTAGGGALAEAGPVVDDAQPRAATADERQALAAFVVQSLDRHPVGEQRAGGVELLTADAIAVTAAGDPRLERQGVLGAALGAGVADAPAV